MQNAESLSRDQIQKSLRSSEPIEFTSGGREERYLWVERVLAADAFNGRNAVICSEADWRRENNALAVCSYLFKLMPRKLGNARPIVSLRRFG